MIEKNFRLAGGGDTTSTALRSSFSTHSKNYLTRKLSSSSLHHSLDSFCDRLHARASYEYKAGGWLSGSGVSHGSTENMQGTERGDIQFFTICSAHYTWLPLQWAVQLRYIGWVRAFRLYMHSNQSGICMTACSRKLIKMHNEHNDNLSCLKCLPSHVSNFAPKAKYVKAPRPRPFLPRARSCCRIAPTVRYRVYCSTNCGTVSPATAFSAAFFFFLAVLGFAEVLRSF